MSPRVDVDRVPDERAPLERLSDLTPASRRLVLSVIGAGGVLLFYTAATIRIDQPGRFVQMLALALLTATVKINLPLSRGVSTLSLSNALAFASILLLDAVSTAVVGMLAAWGQCTFRIRSRNPVHRTLFSMAVVGLAAFAAAIVFEWSIGLSGPLTAGTRADLLSEATWREVITAIIPSAIVYFAVNTLLVAAVISLTSGERLNRVWLGNYTWSAPGYMIAAVVGCSVLLIDEFNQAWSVLVAVPLYLTYRSYRSFIWRIEEERAQVRQLADTQLATIEALALAIEVKDQTSHGQIQRFQVYAEGLARAVGTGDDEIRAIKTAALLHDIGNLAVPDYILGKPGPLTPDEFEKVRIHAQVGASIVSSVPFPYPVSPLILSHHEHWDGSGYPHGLAGAAIPFGARVLTVVDYFTALCVDRPYRPARSHAEATALLRQAAGSTLDPRLVEAFIAVQPQLEATIARIQTATEVARANRSAGVAERNALEDIAGAHREAKVLYEVAQALGSSLQLDDTFNLVAQKLGALLPYSTVALLLADERGELKSSRVIGRGDIDMRRVRRPRPGDPAAEGAGVGADRKAASPLASGYLEAPMKLGNLVIGALAVYHERSDFYTAEHRRLLDLMAHQAAPVVHNSLVFERAQEASLTDPLTGLTNRRAVQQQLAERLSETASHAPRVTVLMFDLDNLKYFNDSFGHHLGDRAIRAVASSLDGHRRRTDLCARYAGDEFVVVLWDCDADEALARARAMQDEIACLSIDVGMGHPMPLAVSVGAARYPEDGLTGDALIATADHRMYLDKARRKRQKDDAPAGGRDAA